MPNLLEHPFAAWIGSLATYDCVTLDGSNSSDIKLKGIAAKRFGLAVYDGAPLLGVLPEDQSAIQAVKWSSAALIINRDNSDWIALSSKDVRPGSNDIGEPVPMRLFIPVQHNRLLAWKDANQNTLLHIAAMDISKGRGSPSLSGSPFLNLPALVIHTPDKIRKVKSA